MSKSNQLSRLIGPLIGVAVLAVAGATALAVAPGSPLAVFGAAATPKPTPPPGPANAAEFDALIADSRARQDQFVRDFVSSGQDPRTLPRVTLSATGPRTDTLRSAVNAADVIVRARVVGITFTPTGGVPDATVTVRIADRLKAGPLAPGAQTLTVRQVGGPMRTATGGALAQLDIDDLLLPGDDVFLLLTARPGLDADYNTIPSAGIYFITPTAITAEHSNVFGNSVTGQAPGQFDASVRAMLR